MGKSSKLVYIKSKKKKLLYHFGRQYVQGWHPGTNMQVK